MLSGSWGFALHGGAAGDNSGASVSALGDVNGDGVEDMIVGAYGAGPYGRYSAGSSYVVFGRPSGQAWPAALDLSHVNGTVRCCRGGMRKAAGGPAGERAGGHERA